MTRDEFTAAVLLNAAGVREYKLGYDGQNPQGWCDCIGLDIGAYVILGVKWPGTHGTNWAARYYTKDLKPINTVGELKTGDVVYKKREPGEQYYDLPDAYKNHPDRRDYYHIGTVTQTNPLRITHCTDVPGGIKTDTTLGKWSYYGTFKNIEDGGGNKPMTQAIVVADQGSTVNMREQPSKASRVIEQVPIGEIVDVYDEGAEWSQIGYKGKKGYMMTMFTVPVAGDPPEDAPPDETEPVEPGGDMVQIIMPMSVAVALYQALDGVIGHG